MPVTASQGVSVTFRKRTLGLLVGASPAFQTGNVYDFTNHTSAVVGDGPGARIIRQYNATSIEPGTITLRLLGSPSITRDDMGETGELVFSWSGGSLKGNAFPTAVDGEFRAGELIQWSVTFQFAGY